MPFSTCCGAETDMTEIDICPECLEHCDREEEDDEPSDEQIANNYRTEGGISFNNNSSWQGR